VASRTNWLGYRESASHAAGHEEFVDYVNRGPEASNNSNRSVLATAQDSHRAEPPREG
jgi:hypothetical protein